MAIKLSPPLAVKNGVSPNKIWLPKGPWQTVFDYFCWRFPQIDHQSCLERFNREEVCFADGQIVRPETVYQSEQHLYFYREVPNEIEVPFRETIIYQDENIIVADKPHFLPVAPSGNYLHHTLLVRLRKSLNNDEIELCHRLDRETAGLVLLTKKESVRAAYHSLFSKRKIVKTYYAIANTCHLKFPLSRKTKLVKGEPYMRMTEVAGEPNSESMISLEQTRGKLSLYQLKPHTGKKHQLRVHMASIGAPIINDHLYPNMQYRSVTDFANPLQLLAKKLEFIDPLSAKQCCFISQRELEFS